jgi:hypothetical protein
VGTLDLKRAGNVCALELLFCQFDEVPNFMYATIAGLELSGSHLPGLSADRMTVTGSVLLNKGFLAAGKVRLVGASIGGQLLLSGSDFAQAELSLDTAIVPGGLFVRNLLQPPLRIVLTDARVGSIVDDHESWPLAGNLLLEGFVYEGFAGEETSTDVRWRLEWISRHPSFRPDVFNQLATVYRRRGDQASARRVTIAKERRRTSVLPNWRKPLHWVWGMLAGYGYRPWLSVVYLIGLVAVGAFRLFPIDAMQPIHDARFAYQSWVYSMDISIPFITFGMADEWFPDPSRVWLLWLATALGWFLSGAFIAAITGIFKPQD